MQTRVAELLRGDSRDHWFRVRQFSLGFLKESHLIFPLHPLHTLQNRLCDRLPLHFPFSVTQRTIFDFNFVAPDGLFRCRVKGAGDIAGRECLGHYKDPLKSSYVATSRADADCWTAVHISFYLSLPASHAGIFRYSPSKQSSAMICNSVVFHLD